MTTTTYNSRNAARRTRSRDQIARSMRANSAKLQMLAEMMTIATKWDDSYEIDRIAREIMEWENEDEALIEEAVAAGYEPEDFE